jgi:hypothetical protein
MPTDAFAETLFEASLPCDVEETPNDEQMGISSVAFDAAHETHYTCEQRPRTQLESARRRFFALQSRLKEFRVSYYSN